MVVMLPVASVTAWHVVCWRAFSQLCRTSQDIREGMTRKLALDPTKICKITRILLAKCKALGAVSYG